MQWSRHLWITIAAMLEVENLPTAEPALSIHALQGCMFELPSTIQQGFEYTLQDITGSFYTKNVKFCI